MAEPDELDYGRYCKHDTNIGTPGGSDYLCGDCESGRDILIQVERWEVKVFVVEVVGESIINYGASTLTHTADRAAAEAQVADLAPLVDRSNGEDGRIKHLLGLQRRLLDVWVSAEELQYGDIVLVGKDEEV
jgi:hypothetical protein